MSRHSKASSKPYKPEPYETIEGRGKNISAAMFAPMLQHESFMSLTHKQKVLYLYMKLQKYGGGKNRPDGAMNDTFYFNWAMASKTYKLYTNNKRFYTDVEALVSAGFIDRVESNAHRFKKNVYRYSDRWYKEHLTYDANVQKNVRKCTKARVDEVKADDANVRNCTELESLKAEQTA